MNAQILKSKTCADKNVKWNHLGFIMSNKKVSDILQ